MAKPKIEVKTQEDLVDFAFFKKTIEDPEKGLYVISATSMKDSEPNRSGSFGLDYDLIVPFPDGRIVEIFGQESTCKTTLGLEIMGNAMKYRGKRALYVNMEKNLNVSLMRTIRSIKPYLDQAIKDLETGTHSECPLWIVNASDGEQALETMRKFAHMVPNGVAMLDSIDAAQPSAVLDEEIGENKVGNLAKLMSDAMRKLVGIADSNKVLLIFINQIRDKITMYGDPKEPPGGKAVRFYASQRIELKKPRKEDVITTIEGDKVGLIIRYNIVKNKFAPEGVEGAFPLLFKNGIFREQELITQCCNFAILKMGGKGGKQVYLPKIDRASNNFLEDGAWMTQFNAARKLLLDQELCSKLELELSKILQTGRHDAVDSMTDEIQESEQ